MQLKLVALIVLTLLVMVGIPGALQAADSPDKKININTATVEDLATLDRVGERYATRIVEYREQNGKFEKVEDIMLVRGIGSQIFELNKERLTVE